MKTLLPLPLLFAACAWADEATDRAAVARAIAALNEFPLRAALFTADSDAPPVLEQLWKGKRPAYRIILPAGDPVPSSTTGAPTVTISHEPWGEATINFPGMPMPSIQAVEVLNPRIVSRTVRFITPDVALADGDFGDGATTKPTRLLFVMKKEGDAWKIASLRVLEPR